MFKPYGVIPALPTPMKEGGVIDYHGLAQLIEHVIENGVHGVLVGGSTGEYSLMSLEERQQVIQFVCDTVDARVPVMAGTGCHSTEDTIKLTQFAEEAGVSSALVINPYYMATSDEGILNHYKAVTENSKIGIVIYHYPDATGIELSPELIHEISQLDGIVGIKNTADGVHTSKLLNLTKDNDRFSLLTGFEDLILATLASGSEYGLAASVWTENIRKAHYISGKLQSGTVWINDVGLELETMPFGGYKQSGIGREMGGEYGLSNYTEVKSVYVNMQQK
ncbi:dihydrodipicolinate synthase family protein [Mammaliicoccus sciuri]|uniref:dihydrodipicolinate synthase family protein n=1 Tax=Mammaliicoccus sciuri TaxID=1296 RepID=UPI003B9E8BF6